MIISSTHLFSVMKVTVSVQFCLLACIVDILGYIIYIIRERKNVHSYMAWSCRELRNYYACLSKQRTSGTTRYSPGYHHGNSDDENDPNRRYLDSKCIFISFLTYYFVFGKLNLFHLNVLYVRLNSNYNFTNK